MRTATYLALSVLFAAAPANITLIASGYPADVDSFIERVAECATLSPADKELFANWKCGALAADRVVLIKKYRDHPALVEALRDQWVKKIVRIPTKIVQ